MADQSQTDWRNAAFRSKMIQTIGATLQKNGIMNYGGQQLANFENSIFGKSSSYEEYKTKISKLIQHMQDSQGSRAKQPQQLQQQELQQQQSMYQQGMGTAQYQIQGQQQMGPGMMQNQQQMSMGQQQVPPGQSYNMMGGGGIGNMSAGPYSAESQFASSPAPSQPQIPPQANFMPAYSPGPGLPMPSPTQSAVRIPQPSPSMSISVNTPAPVTAHTPQDPGAPSPAFPSQTQSSSDEEMYMEKVRELSSYIEPLKKMLSKMAKEGKTNLPDYNKLGVLLNLLQPTNNKTTYEMLCKCEDVLKKLKLPTAFKASKEGIHEQSSHWCQPLLTAVAESINASMCKNALRQTFGPALHVLYGPNISAAVQQRTTNKKRKPSPSSTANGSKVPNDVPHLIQGELARLDRKFKVTRDKSYEDIDDYNNGMGLRLQCTLDAKGLPSVPPIRFTLPEDYPQTNPLCEMSMEMYDTSEFFIDIKSKFISSLKKLQNKYSMTALLDTWLASIKQTCSNIKKEDLELKPPIAALT